MFTSYRPRREALLTSKEQVSYMDAIAAKPASKFGTQLSAQNENGIFGNNLVEKPQPLMTKGTATHKHKEISPLMDLVCHELRNSLSGIDGNVQLLEEISVDLEQLLQSEEGQTLDSKLRSSILQHLQLQKSALRTIEVCAQHQKVVTQDALNLSKLESGAFELRLRQINPKNIIKEAVTMLDSAIKEKELEVYLNFAYDDSIVNIDADRFRQVILNLLSNAIKFTPKGGEITLAMAKPEMNDANTILKVSVKDNGIGMTEEERERIFNPFVQANAKISSQYGGTGLGLSISKQLVELMNGRIEVESKKSKGTKFSVTIKCPNSLEIQNQPASPLIFSAAKLKASPLKQLNSIETFPILTAGHRRVTSLAG